MTLSLGRLNDWNFSCFSRRSRPAPGLPFIFGIISMAPLAKERGIVAIAPDAASLALFRGFTAFFRRSVDRFERLGRQVGIIFRIEAHVGDELVADHRRRNAAEVDPLVGDRARDL